MSKKRYLKGGSRVIAVGAVSTMVAGSGSVSACSVTYRSSNSMSTGVSTSRVNIVSNSSSTTRSTSTRSRLDGELRQHAALATPVLQARLLNDSSANALSNVMDRNSQMIANTVERLYPGTHDQFLRLWRSHIRYYEQYLIAAQHNNQSGKQQARQNLANFTANLTTLLKNANPRINSAYLQQQLTIHGNQTLAIIDNLAARNYNAAHRLSPQAINHMDRVAAAMTGTTTSR